MNRGAHSSEGRTHCLSSLRYGYSYLALLEADWLADWLISKMRNEKDVMKYNMILLLLPNK